ncbi:toll/interleukin-1 receptor domain-containing protein [Clavibacter tessellarius]|uniref:toll/interleukin-1 receptor domain-containing protein n=1 Tax=Clavibacter tessellarius TaxID=31965 RepID=UPI0039EB7B38
MTITNDSAVAFFSYAHEDDDADKGRIRRIATALQLEYKLLTGQELEVFFDRTSLRWGDQWKERIDGALQSTTFFIPVLSETYFAREECRREFLVFYRTTKSLGVLRYLLALRYASVDDMQPDSSDQAKAVAASTQYKDWTALRLVEEDSAEHRQAINDLAVSLKELMQEVRLQPANDAIASTLEPAGQSASRKSKTPDSVSSTAPLTETMHVDKEDPYDDTISPLELIAELPTRVAAWTKTTEDWRDASNEFNAVLTQGNVQLLAADGSQKPLAKKLSILRQVANDIEAPSRRIELVGESYLKALLEVDPSFQAIADLGQLQTAATVADHEALHATQDAVRSMVVVGAAATASVRSAIESGRGLARLSRDLRPALRRFESGSNNIVDGQAIIEDWYKRLSEVSLPTPTPTPKDSALEGVDPEKASA